MLDLLQVWDILRYLVKYCPKWYLGSGVHDRGLAVLLRVCQQQSNPKAILQAEWKLAYKRVVELLFYIQSIPINLSVVRRADKSLRFLFMDGKESDDIEAIGEEELHWRSPSRATRGLEHQ